MDSSPESSSTTDSDTSKADPMILSYLDIFNILKGNLHNGYRTAIQVLQEYFATVDGTYIIPESFATSTVKILQGNLLRRWKASNHIKKDFLSKNESWLQKTCQFPRCDDINQIPAECSPVKKKKKKIEKKTDQKKFSDISSRHQYRRSEPLRDSSSSPEDMCFSASILFKNQKKIDCAFVLEALANYDEAAASQFRKNFETIGQPHKLSPLDAVDWLVKMDATKEQYEFSYHKMGNLPPYKEMLKAKQECYPSGIHVTGHFAQISVQDTVNHTAKRICESLREIIEGKRITETNLQKLWLQCKVGSDGSSGHSNYKQDFTDANGIKHQDSCMFVTSLVPLRLFFIDEITKKVTVLWDNPVPSSPAYCRPLRLQFSKETNEVILAEKSWIDEQIIGLQPLRTNIGAANIEIMFQIFPTMYDVKAINAMTGIASTHMCYICKLSSKHFNDIEICLDAVIRPGTLQYGMSTLHARIRFFEFTFNLACKLPFESPTLGKKNNLYPQYLEHKKQLQKKFSDILQLKVSQPKQGCGNTNDGNTARKAFGEPEKTAEITGIDLEIIERFARILEAITCGYDINPTIFGDYCIETAKKYKEKYNWFPMSPTVHKVLIHGKDIIANIPLPIGRMSEEAQEATNKLIRKYREKFSRKFSREETMKDVVNRLSVNSDPKIASLRKIKTGKKKGSIRYCENNACSTKHRV